MSGQQSRRQWGWHPLTDIWASRVVVESDVRRGEFVVDIGAGDGALTAHLVAAGARVLAVELRSGRAQRLRSRFEHENVRVVEVDALGFRWPRRPFRVVVSPPFGITGALVRSMMKPGSGLTAADLVLQRAAVRKHAERSHLARWTMREGIALPRTAFRPPPQVDSSVLVIRRR
ncbi:23S rRNA (adenine(2058)-N(6))-methyltransferase Erm(41) [Mycobacterium sp. CBMA271]|uniref:23S rRNA (adenine(2058)-N(6))-methyltransferase Erm(41) n=1 Tax=unclassified Mycobacteroides TaxID=2618759 RepID=UPI00132BCF08|nr:MULTISPECIES: 23S rRNA (adenine(2058)-N(6))-methyltransferase Erm(41) [unclassified Mycobacteroides]MUM17795.1 methyltransferase [Mycobacteroides sp. CBMA 326]MUM22931.1 23S rRNA (adenine(2058)-N(6))-methyltransferase Erm(41) [Mycobacteroides sp. CBMA 271]